MKQKKKFDRKQILVTVLLILGITLLTSPSLGITAHNPGFTTALVANKSFG